MDAAQLKQEFEKTNAKLDRLEALRCGAKEESKGRTSWCKRRVTGWEKRRSQEML